jgi:hypothetical protein
LRKRRILLGVRRFPFATLSTRELVTPHSRLLALDGAGFAASSGRGSLVSVVASQRASVVRVTGVRARERNVMLSTILIIILILLLIGALPTWPYSSGWGYYPGGTLGLILIIVIILALIGRI